MTTENFLHIVSKAVGKPNAHSVYYAIVDFVLSKYFSGVDHTKIRDAFLLTFCPNIRKMCDGKKGRVIEVLGEPGDVNKNFLDVCYEGAHQDFIKYVLYYESITNFFLTIVHIYYCIRIKNRFMWTTPRTDVAKIEQLIRGASKCSNALDSKLRSAPTVSYDAVQKIYAVKLTNAIVALKEFNDNPNRRDMEMVEIEGAAGLFVEIPDVACTMKSVFSKEDEDNAMKIQNTIACLE